MHLDKRERERFEQGFTLIELLTVVAIIGVLAAIALANYNMYRNRGLIAQAASELKNFGTAFMAYNYLEGDYPPDSHNELPPGMEDYIPPASFNKTTPLGGRYNWEGPDGYPYAGVAISEPTAAQSLIVSLDSMMDNGDLSSGRFRTGSNGRPTFILEELP